VNGVYFLKLGGVQNVGYYRWVQAQAALEEEKNALNDDSLAHKTKNKTELKGMYIYTFIMFYSCGIGSLLQRTTILLCTNKKKKEKRKYICY